MNTNEKWAIRVCPICGRDLDGATGCLGTVGQRHRASGGVLVEVVRATRLSEVEVERDEARAHAEVEYALAESRLRDVSDLASRLQTATATLRRIRMRRPSHDAAGQAFHRSREDARATLAIVEEDR